MRKISFSKFRYLLGDRGFQQLCLVPGCTGQGTLSQVGLARYAHAFFRKMGVLQTRKSHKKSKKFPMETQNQLESMYSFL